MEHLYLPISKKKNWLPFIVRKNEKDHGTQNKVEGVFSLINKDAHIILIDDVVTTAQSTLQAYYAIKELGFDIKYVVCIVDRNEGGKENLQKENLELHPLFTIQDFLVK